MSGEGYLHQPPNTLPRVESIWAVLSIDEDGNEGVVAASIGPGGTMVPLIAADETRIKELLPIARNMAKDFQMKMKLVKFNTREEVEIFDGTH